MSAPAASQTTEINVENTAHFDASATLKANRMATLLSIEASAREAATIKELAIKAVNDPRTLTGFSQAFFLNRTSSGHYKTLAITSQSDTNRHAPLIQMVEECARQIFLEESVDEPITFNLQQIKTTWHREQFSYPYPEFQWMPIIHSTEGNKRTLLGGLLLSRQTPWREVDVIVLMRIASTYAHAWNALNLQRKARPVYRHTRKVIAAIIAAVFCLLMMLPVPYTAVAPAQIIAEDPFIVSAPIEGVIEEIHVNPNEEITKDQLLFSFVDTSLRNSAIIAQNELLLADARSQNIRRNALIDNEGRREIAIANAEKTLAQTREAYARELLNNVTISAPKDGIVLFTSKNDFAGRPVSTGEKIMEIADPTAVAVAIEISPGDALAIQIGQPVNVYLDTDPLKPLTGTMTRASFTPSATESGTLAYRAIVALDSETTPLPRIGLRGSAKLNAGKTSLGYWLFRKPIVVIRRYLGI